MICGPWRDSTTHVFAAASYRLVLHASHCIAPETGAFFEQCWCLIQPGISVCWMERLKFPQLYLIRCGFWKGPWPWVKSLAMFSSKYCKHVEWQNDWNPPVESIYTQGLQNHSQRLAMQACSWAGTVTLPSSNFEGVAACWGSSSSSDSYKTTTQGSCTCNLPSDKSTHLADGKWGKTAT